MNRDDSAEEKKEERVPRGADVPTHTNIDRVTRMRITKRAKRFERYGLIQDGQQLVDLVAEIAGGLDGKPTSEPKPPSPYAKKDKS